MNQYPPDPWQNNVPQPQTPFYPYTNNPGSPAGNYPIQQPPQTYGYPPYNAPASAFNPQNQMYPASYLQNQAYPAPSLQNQLNPALTSQGQKRPFLLALFLFPLLCLKVLLLPTAGTFRGEKDRAGWGFIGLYLLILAGITLWLASLWGHLPQLTPVVYTYSFGRITPRAFTIAECYLIALATPILFLALNGVMCYTSKRLGGPGTKITFLAQCYTTSLIIAPVILINIALTYVLLLSHALSPTLRTGMIGAEVFLLGYAIILHVLAVMGVQGLGAGKATTVVFSASLLLAVVLGLGVLMLMAMSDGSSSSGGGSGHSSKSDSNKNSHSNRGGHSSGDLFTDSSRGGGGQHNQHSSLMMMTCPTCGAVRQLLRGQPALPCINCGMSMQPFSR